MVYGGQGFKIRVGVVLVHPNQSALLLLKQNQRDFWVLPGGTLEASPPETLADCAIREVWEETHLRITLQRLLYVGDFMAPLAKRSVDVVFLAVLASDCLPEQAQLNPAETVDDMAWVAFDDLSTQAVQPQPLFARLVANYQAGTLVTPTPNDQQNAYVGAYSP
jgi:ADP-ribose pyrophosphatase YjhB (NUDIX family)